MDRVREKSAENRAHTDASLVAERASTDAANDRTSTTAQDDLLERDRVVEDERLLKFRENADSTLARERLGSTPPDRSVALERHADDDRKVAEREVTDDILYRERQGADAVVETERREHEAHVVPHEARRHDTDHQLSTERLDSDITVTELADTKRALALSQSADLTERKRAEKALHETERQLRHAQKMEAVGVLAGGIAHDLNNLLSVILSYSELLANDLKPGDPMRADLEDINGAGLRAADLTRQLLAFSRQQILQPRIVDLNDVVVGMEKMLRRVIGESVELTSLAGPALSKIMVDPGQMEQVIMNLSINARDAMPNGGKLTIETADVLLNESDAAAHPGVNSGPHVMLTVTDTGVGMDKVTQSRMFEPFFTTKEIGKGTGLGLSTVFGIVKQSGGAIWASSELGRGTSFRTYFPVTTASGIIASPVSEAHERRTLHGSETILVVEDEERVRVLACTILRKYGYQVLEAQSGGDALIVCEQHQGTIHLLLTDVVMPRVNGLQLAARLMPSRPEMKVLYMSGYTGGSGLEQINASGAPVFQKPITPERLARRVREVFGASRNHVQ